MNIGKQNKASPSLWEKVWKARQEQSYPASNLGTEAAVVHVTGLKKGEKRVSGTATCPSLSHITKKCLRVFPLHGPRLFLLWALTPAWPSSSTTVCGRSQLACVARMTGSGSRCSGVENSPLPKPFAKAPGFDDPSPKFNKTKASLWGVSEKILSFLQKSFTEGVLGLD